MIHYAKLQPLKRYYYVHPSDVSNLPGMRCTDNDLAFLQRMENMKQYKILKVRNHTAQNLNKLPQNTFSIRGHCLQLHDWSIPGDLGGIT